MLSEKSTWQKFNSKRHFFILGVLWFLAGLLSRIQEDLGALFTLLALGTSVVVFFFFIRYVKLAKKSRKEILINFAGIIAVLLSTAALAPIGISLSEKIKPLSQQELEAKQQEILSEKVSFQTKPEQTNQNITQNPVPKPSNESCKQSEFVNCKIKANLLIDSAYARKGFDPLVGFLCTKHSVTYQNLTEEKVTGIKGYFVMDIYFTETFSQEMESGRYVLSDKYGVPFWFALNKKLQPISLDSRETKTFSGEYCDPLTKDLSTALLHLQGKSTETWKMEFVLEELQIESNRTLKFDDGWVGNLCSTADLSWAIVNNGTLSDCRQRTT